MILCSTSTKADRKYVSSWFSFVWQLAMNHFREASIKRDGKPHPASLPSMTSSQADRSSTRSKILKESLAASQQQQGPKTVRKATWMKPPTFEGFQSTLDSNNNMRKLRPSRPSQINSIPWRIGHDHPNFPRQNSRTRERQEGDAVYPSLRHSWQHLPADAIIIELENLRQDSSIGEAQPDAPGISDIKHTSQPIPKDIEGDDLILEPTVLNQPETRPISHDDLVKEVKGMFSL